MSPWFSWDGLMLLLICTIPALGAAGVHYVVISRCHAESERLKSLLTDSDEEEALRGQNRWGVGSIAQAFHGYQHLALDAGAGSIVAWQILGIAREGATPEAIHAAYKRAALRAHPDQGGSREAWDALQSAREDALREISASDGDGGGERG